MTRLMAALFTALCGLLAVFALAIMPRLPVNWVPWKRPDLDAAPTVFAHIAVNHLKLDAGMCQKAIAAADRFALQSTPRP